MNQRTFAIATTLVVLAFVATVYWPIRDSTLIWDDLVCLRDQTWLTEPDAWQVFLFHDFCSWRDYFRPAAVAVFLAEVRTFALSAGPMHLVSLGIHLANTLLVGIAGFALRKERPERPWWIVTIAMLCYGLHPMLIEPVAWISAQTELLVTLFMLLGFLGNIAVQRPLPRALAVSACFFLAASSKESAIAFPLVIALYDWMKTPRTIAPAIAVRGILREQWKTYLGMFVAGLAYLWLRHEALGYLVYTARSVPLPALVRAQEVPHVYLTYLRMLIWPMIGLGPVHLIDERQFAAITLYSSCADLAALLILAYGAYCAIARKQVGGTIAIVTLLLLPVLHIVPVAFDESLYHDRYAMSAIAFAAILLPASLRWPTSTGPTMRLSKLGAVAAASVWLVMAIVNIRVTLPLWSNEIGIWQWALRANPTSMTARSNLLATYILRGDPRTREFSDALLANSDPCQTCFLYIAHSAMNDGDFERAARALTRLNESVEAVHDPRLQHAYDIAAGRLLDLTGDMAGSEAAFRDAIASDPRDPAGFMQLALLLARQGRQAEAREAATLAIPLLAPGQRAEFAEKLDAAGASPAKPAP